MSVNKNALVRYKTLDKCFSNPYRKYYITDLIDQCSETLSEYYGEDMSVSRRQIFDDINFMKSVAGYEAPIESKKEGRKVYYRYEDLSFSIQNNMLSQEDHIILNEVINTLGRIGNINHLEWVSALQTKLSSEILTTHSNKKVISFQDNEFLKGSELLYLLYQYIINKQVIVLTYKPFSKYESKVIVSPSYLKQYNNRWFLFGWNHEAQFIQNFALDRILKIQHSLKDNYNITNVNFDEYFEDIIGVTNHSELEIEEVIIEITPTIIPYINSKPIHGSQRIKENTLFLEVKLNYELESLILSYGENMKVIKPYVLRDKILNRIKIMNLIYQCS